MLTRLRRIVARFKLRLVNDEITDTSRDFANVVLDNDPAAMAHHREMLRQLGAERASLRLKIRTLSQPRP